MGEQGLAQENASAFGAEAPRRRREGVAIYSRGQEYGRK
jgi:hypothetical protein